MFDGNFNIKQIPQVLSDLGSMVEWVEKEELVCGLSESEEA